MKNPNSPTKSKLHYKGAHLISSLVPDDNLRVVLAPKYLQNCKFPDVDMIIKNQKTKNVYEVRVPTTTRTRYVNDPVLKRGLIWRVKRPYFKNPDPYLFYCFTIIGNDKENQKSRIFIIPSEIVVKSLVEDEEYNKKQFGKILNNNFLWFFLGSKAYGYPRYMPFEEDYENKWELFK